MVTGRRQRLRVRGGILLMTPVLLAACNSNADKAQPIGQPPEQIGVTLQTKQPRYAAGTTPELTMVLRNNGSGPCALPSAELGSVEILSVKRDGVAVIGRPGREYLYNGMATVVADSLRTVAPDESLTVPLDAELDSNNKPVLSITRQTESDDGRTTSWTLDQPGRYQVTARIAPARGVQRSDTPPLCQSPSPSATTEFDVS